MNKKLPHEDHTPHAEPAVERDGESFGIWLRRQREGREIELEEISKTSKIGMTYLRAFEEERFEILPASVFAKGFLRQYALFVGLDPEEVVNFYLQSCQETGGEDLSSTSAGRARASEKSNLGWMLFVGALLLIVLFWIFSRPSGKTSDSPKSSTLVDRSESLDSPSAVLEPPLAEAGADQPNDLLAAEEAPAVPPESAIPLRVILDFAEECWIEARVDGKQQVAELKIQGESLLLEANEVVELKIGNIDAVEMEVNENPFALEPKNGAVQNLRIDLASVRQRAEAPGEE